MCINEMFNDATQNQAQGWFGCSWEVTPSHIWLFLRSDTSPYFPNKQLPFKFSFNQHIFKTLTPPIEMWYKNINMIIDQSQHLYNNYYVVGWLISFSYSLNLYNTPYMGNPVYFHLVPSIFVMQLKGRLCAAASQFCVDIRIW